MKQVTALPDSYLSSLIVDFHPKSAIKISKLSQETIRIKLHDWLCNVQKLLDAELTKLLNLIVDIKRLHKIHEETSYLQYPSNWEAITGALLVDKKLNIYEGFMKIHMTKRVKELVEKEWQKGIDAVVLNFRKIDEELKKER